ncbi:MAG: SRPBCC family protein [Fimbriimonadaceae bacterium]|nr:SRPBCC family protein [Fimbriimonadaceae bacterium]
MEQVYAIAKDNGSFPEFMEDLESLTVVEVDGPRVVSDYVGIVKAFGLKVRWQQEDLWRDEDYRCEFRQIQGDYDSMSGWWTFRPENEGTRFDSELSYEYVVPGLGPLVGRVIKGLVQKNVDNILLAIKARAEA